ncbi:RNA polymerase sigma factor [Pelagerythrobacter aerophilus]|uniref:RNA polymerase sigma factor n=1 Tax=Pelagerythrobacter aerophilus TaxID=2306995 RepID=UPI0011C43EF2|nr:hypothetical protein [Pelagerythrobacter aerophilus]
MQDAVYEEETQDADHLSVDEVRETIRQLGKSDAAKIRQAACWFECRCGMPADDLMQEAFVRMVSGSRRVPRGPHFVAVVVQIIRSIASAEIDAIAAGQREVRSLPDGTDGPEMVDSGPSPECMVLSAHDDGQILTTIDHLIEDDEQLQLLVEGLCDGMMGEELEQLLEVDTRGLATVRKRLKRRLLSAFPKGREQ